MRGNRTPLGGVGIPRYILPRGMVMGRWLLQLMVSIHMLALASCASAPDQHTAYFPPPPVQPPTFEALSPAPIPEETTGLGAGEFETVSRSPLAAPQDELGSDPNRLVDVSAASPVHTSGSATGAQIGPWRGDPQSATPQTYKSPSYQSPIYQRPQPTYSAAVPPAYKPYCAENGSCYGDISAATGRAKTVSVGGYYRKNGTYVRGHYRSAPRRRY